MGAWVGAGLLGFAMGGFFDGILLHQILGWHHLLSAVDATPWDQVAWQVTADGWFHAAMYGVAAVGLWLGWRDGRGAPPMGAVLAGFGAWHLVDTLLVHWVMRLHRVRMDVAAPLAWDVGWAAVFGVVPVVAGLRLGGRGSGGQGGGGAVGAVLPVVALALGLGAALPVLDPARAATLPPGCVFAARRQGSRAGRTTRRLGPLGLSSTTAPRSA